MNKWGSGGCNVLKDYSIKFPWFTAQVPNILYGTGINCIILWISSVSERWCYSLTSSLIGWAHSQNDPWWRLRDPTPAVKWCICHIPRAPFKYPIGCLIARPHKVSKLQDLYLELYDHSEIWWLGAQVVPTIMMTFNSDGKVFIVKLPTDECHWTLLKMNQHWLR